MKRIEVQGFIQANALASREYSANTIIVFDQSLESEIRKAEKGEVELLGGRVEDLLARFEEELAVSGRAVFRPRLKTLRHFYSPQGFISSMERLAEALPHAGILIPAGLYGRGPRLLFGLRVRQD